MARLMYDSTNPFDIPLGAPVVGGYVDGIYAWPQAGWDRFPGAAHVRICISLNTLDADVIDVEPGAATPDDAANWINQKHARGEEGAIYFSASIGTQIGAALQRWGSRTPLFWVANWDNVAQLPPGYVAKQYANPTLTGAHYDLSVAADYWPGVDAAPSGTGTSPPLPAGIDGARVAWTNLGDFFANGLPGTISDLALNASRLGSDF